ncbi:AAA family ATPase [Melissococcus plutonius]|uniref:ATP-binding protein n=1 Tax=Melissococcus plutonius TaxID=33970 RepID=UPI003C2B8BF8
MKITAIEIVGFGKWQQKKINFTENNQLVNGKNEAGKSTIYQFIQTILFGFPARGKKKREFLPKNGGAYGGRLWIKHTTYGIIQIERFKDKNKGQAKVYYNGQVGDEKKLEEILYPLTKELFQEVFTFQQEQLNELGKLTEEQLQTSLLALGISGSQNLLIKKAEYLKTAQMIYRGKGIQPPLNQQLKNYQQLQEKINQQEEQQYSFQQITKNIKEKQTLIQNNQQLITKKKQELAKVESKKQNFAIYKELQTLKSLDEPITINKQDWHQLEEGYQKYQFLTSQLLELEQKEVKKEVDKKLIDDYQFYLKEEETIQSFLSQKKLIKQLILDQEWLEQSCIKHQKEIESLEKCWQWSRAYPPQLTMNVEEIQNLKKQLSEYKKHAQQLQNQLEIKKEELNVKENNLTIFEAEHQEMFHPKIITNKQKKYYFLGIFGVICILFISFLLPNPIKYFGLIVEIFPIMFILYTFKMKTKNLLKEEKKQWQEKLSQIDYLNEQLHVLQEQLQLIKEKEKQLMHNIEQQVKANHLGRMDQLDFWINQKQDIERYHFLIHTIDDLTIQRKENAAFVQQFIKQINQLTDYLPLQGKSLDEQLEFINNFAEQMESFRIAEDDQLDKLKKHTINELKNQKQELLDSLQPLLIRYHISSVTMIESKLKYLRKRQAQKRHQLELESMVTGIFEKKEIITKEELATEFERLSWELNELINQTQDLRKDEQKLLYAKQQFLTNGSLDELYQQQADLKAEIDELAQEWTINQLAGQLLMDLLTELSDKQLPALMKQTSYYFQLLTADNYQTVQIIDNVIYVIDKNSQYFTIYDLSSGTKDQLIMAVRFAFLSLQEKPLCPIIIDDGWLHYDETRKYQLAMLFKEFGRKYQIICFSSDQEMLSYYQELSQPIIYLEGEKNEKTS